MGGFRDTSSAAYGKNAGVMGTRGGSHTLGPQKISGERPLHGGSSQLPNSWPCHFQPALRPTVLDCPGFRALPRALLQPSTPPPAGAGAAAAAPRICLPKQEKVPDVGRTFPAPPHLASLGEEFRGRSGPQLILAINRDLRHRLLKIPGWRPIKEPRGAPRSTTPLCTLNPDATQHTAPPA